MTNPKKHYTAAQMRGLLALNSAIKKRDPLVRFGASHLANTKHGKAYLDYGYPIHPDFWVYHAAYSRIGLGKAVVRDTVDQCWLSPPEIDDEKFTAFAERVGLWGALKEVDEMQRVGSYAGLIIRVRDAKRLNEPLDRASLDDIVQLMPAWEGQLLPSQLDTDQESDTYGLPLTYTYHQQAVASNNARDGNESFTVHHSRVLIWNEGAHGNTIYGTSALEPVLNALIDWEKIRGSGGEGYWRNAALRGVLEAKDGTAAPSESDLDDLLETITDMHSSFDAIPYLGGASLNTLQTSLSDPSGFAEIVLNDIAAGCGRSAKALVGAQEGRLAGEADSSKDARSDQSRRENYLSGQIRKMLNRFIELDAIPSKRYTIEWDSLLEPTKTQRVELAERMGKTNVMGRPVFTVEECREAAGYDPEIEIPEPEFKDGEEIS